jgi:hypothetical protein
MYLQYIKGTYASLSANSLIISINKNEKTWKIYPKFEKVEKSWENLNKSWVKLKKLEIPKKKEKKNCNKLWKAGKI